MQLKEYIDQKNEVGRLPGAYVSDNYPNLIFEFFLIKMDPMGSNADWFLITSLFCSKLNSVKAFIDYNYTVHHTSFNVVLPMNEKLEKGAE